MLPRLKGVKAVAEAQLEDVAFDLEEASAAREKAVADRASLDQLVYEQNCQEMIFSAEATDRVSDAWAHVQHGRPFTQESVEAGCVVSGGNLCPHPVAFGTPTERFSDSPTRHRRRSRHLRARGRVANLPHLFAPLILPLRSAATLTGHATATDASCDRVEVCQRLPT